MTLGRIGRDWLMTWKGLNLITLKWKRRKKAEAFSEDAVTRSRFLASIWTINCLAGVVISDRFNTKTNPPLLKMGFQ